MRRNITAAGVLVLLFTTGNALAGMPSLNFNDVVELRLEDISFFATLVLLCAWGIKSIWNALARDFTRLPRLTYRRALALTALWGLALLLILSMISGARELLTPGAWRREGVTYKIKPAAMDPIARRAAIEGLGSLLQAYASQHQKQFPPNEYDPAIPAVVWQLPDGSGTRFIYLPGYSQTNDRRVIVVEPSSQGEPRYLYRANGSVEQMTTTYILRELNQTAPSA